MSARVSGPCGSVRGRDACLARDLYESGHTIHYVAAMFGRSYGWTYDLLIEAGTVMRSQGSRRKQATALVPEYGMHVNTIRRCRT